MEAAQEIRTAVSSVSQLRSAQSLTPSLGAAVGEVKRFQSRRFEGDYRDLLDDTRYRGAARFFLNELYSDGDYAERDAQFSRIAGAMQRFFPQQVVATAVGLAQLHALTETLDHAMGIAWSESAHEDLDEAERYVKAWRVVGRRPDRERQLQAVIGLGSEMERLTRAPGLRTMLKMMRAPAAAAGLRSLQAFLERGFDTFAQMAQRPDAARQFLTLIEKREAAFLEYLFDGEVVACGTRLRATLGQAR